MELAFYALVYLFIAFCVEMFLDLSKIKKFKKGKEFFCFFWIVTVPYAICILFKQHYRNKNENNSRNV